MGCGTSRAQSPPAPTSVRTTREDIAGDSSSRIDHIPTVPSTQSCDWRNFLSFNTFFNQTDEPQIFEYKFIRSIGRGAHAEVYLVEHVETAEKYAAKIYSKTFLYKNTMDHEQMIDKIAREIEIMAAFNHRNIMQLKEVLDDDETNSVIFILLYAPHGSLLPRNTISKPIPEERCRWIFAQVALAVREIHSVNVAHRDIKPENIMMHEQDRAMLGDFSASIMLPDDNDIVEDTDGTPVYYSPEECRGTAYHAKPADVWALGVSLYVMVFGHLPFFDTTNDGYYLTQLFKISRMIQTNKLELDPAVKISKDLEDLFTKILDKDPTTRITMDRLIEHPWVRKAEYDPEHVQLPRYLRAK